MKGAQAMNYLKERFVSGRSRIAYRELSERGGDIIAWFRNDRWFYRHESEADADARFEAMSAARARAIFPTDAREVEA
jgi:hypothetical protein